MTLITRLIATAAIVSAIGVNALSVSSSGTADHLARHNRHAQHAREANEDLVEKSVNASVELEERSAPKKVGLAWAGNNDNNIAKFVSSTTK